MSTPSSSEYPPASLAILHPILNAVPIFRKDKSTTSAYAPPLCMMYRNEKLSPFAITFEFGSKYSRQQGVAQTAASLRASRSVESLIKIPSPYVPCSADAEDMATSPPLLEVNSVAMLFDSRVMSNTVAMFTYLLNIKNYCNLHLHNGCNNSMRDRHGLSVNRCKRSTCAR
jgi:hypothetical protein